MDKYNRLLDFRNANRHSCVPFNEGELGCWVNTQRQNKRKGKLQPHREALLNKADFVWAPQEFLAARRRRQAETHANAVLLLSSVAGYQYGIHLDSPYSDAPPFVKTTPRTGSLHHCPSLTSQHAPPDLTSQMASLSCRRLCGPERETACLLRHSLATRSEMPDETFNQPAGQAGYLRTQPSQSMAASAIQSTSPHGSPVVQGEFHASYAPPAHDPSFEEPVTFHNRESAQQILAPSAAEDFVVAAVINPSEVPEQEIEASDLNAGVKAALAEADSVFQRSRKGYGNRLNFRHFLDALGALRVHVPYHTALHIFAEAGGVKDGWIDQDEFALAYACAVVMSSRGSGRD